MLLEKMCTPDLTRAAAMESPGQALTGLPLNKNSNEGCSSMLEWLLAVAPTARISVYVD
jgi:hypothetical protein